MGNIPIINPTQNPVTGIPNTRASGDDFGAQVGGALAGLGSNLQELAGTVAAHEARTNDVTGRLALSKARLDMTQALIQQENDAAPGGAGFSDGYLKGFDDYQTKALDGLPNDPKVRDAFAVGMGSLRAEMGAKAMVSEASMASAKQTDDAHQTLNTGINTVNTDPSQYYSVITEGYSAIDALHLPADSRTALKTEFTNSAAAARFDALFRAAKTPDAVTGIIDDLEKGQWKTVMGAKTYDDLLTLAKSTQKSMLALAKTDATGALDSVEGRMKDGATISPDEMADVTAKVRAAADESLSRRFMTLATTNDTKIKARGLSTTDLKEYKTTMAGQATIGSPSASAARDYFTRLGYSDAAAAGIVGNLFGESALNPGAVGDGGVSFGVAQWNSDRLANLKKFAAARGKPFTDFETQLAFVDYELKTSETGAYNALRNATTVEGATAAFMGFERPSGWSVSNPTAGAGWSRRLAAAQAVAGGAPLPTEISFIKSQAAGDVLDARQKRVNAGDAMGAANDAGTISLSPLTDPASFQMRGQQAQQVAGYYNQATPTPFTPDEVDQFKAVMDRGTIEDKISLLNNVDSMGGDISKAAFAQIGEKAPLMGYVGGLNTFAPDVAREVLRGAQKFQDNPDYKAILSSGGEANTSALFAQTVGGTLDHAAPGEANAVHQAADDLYIERNGLATLGQAIDPNKYKQAVRDVLGANRTGDGIADVNGEPTVLPPGVTGDQFETMLNNLTDDDLVRFSLDGSRPLYGDDQQEPVPPADIASEGKFRAIGNGQYLIQMADGKLLAGGVNGNYVFNIDAKGVSEVAERAPAEGMSDAEINAAIKTDLSLKALSDRLKQDNASPDTYRLIMGTVAVKRRAVGEMVGPPGIGLGLGAPDIPPLKGFRQ